MLSTAEFNIIFDSYQRFAIRALIPFDAQK